MNPIKKTSVDIEYTVGKKSHGFTWTVVGDFTDAMNAAIVEAKRRHKSARKIVWTATASFTTTGPFEPAAPTMAENPETAASPWIRILTKDELKARYELMSTCDMRFATSQRELYERQTEQQLRGHINAAWHASDSTSFQLARSYFFHLTGERYGNGGL